ncbi:hypothetical protein MMC32_007651 [Xylographa parallela]|nr:hypothetical protein [Xylographa parallela]
MAGLEELAHIVVRQATTAAASAAASAATAIASAPPSSQGCPSDNDYNGQMGARISAIFVILIGSFFGAVFPVFAQKNQGLKVPQWAFFIAKYFGSGVIIATAFIHLLAPACEALTDPCLTGPITEYDWAEGIALMTIFVLFFTELMAMRYSTFGHAHEHDDAHSHRSSRSSHSHDDPPTTSATFPLPVRTTSEASGHTPGNDHLGHSREHVDHDLEINKDKPTKDFAAQMTAIFILEFGVVFHSIFVGLTLAVSGSEFATLYVVLVFHQTFEGLGLGSRLAATPWPKSRSNTPYWMGLAYAFSTPVALAVGLGVRNSYAPGSQTALIVNGVFDSISAGILIYTGLVELMAHEFMFSEVMRKARLRVVLSAFGVMCLGAGKLAVHGCDNDVENLTGALVGLMALLGKWA